MRLRTLVAACALLLAAGCGTESPEVAVLMPDHRQQNRWDDEGARIEAVLEDAGVSTRVRNAEGDAADQEEHALAAMRDGARVLVVTALDSVVATRIAALAARRGVRVVEYERPYSLRPTDGYVGFDYRLAGRLMAEGLLRCADGRRVAVLDGPREDRAARLLREGYDEALAASGARVVARRHVEDWDAEVAQTLFELMLVDGVETDAVLAAHDDLAGAVLRVVEARGLDLAVAGQGATEDAVERVRAGAQCLTLREPTERAVGAVAALARELLRGGQGRDVLVRPVPVEG